jgi:tol-pal system protein YbgF
VTGSVGARRPLRRAHARSRVRGLVSALGIALGLAGCLGALRQDVDRQDVRLTELRAQVDGLRETLESLRADVAGLRAALEGGLGRAAAAREVEDTRAGEAQEALTGRLAAVERRAEDLADGVTGLEIAVATLAEQFARLEAGSAGAATLRRSGPPGARQAGSSVSAEELFDRGMESYRAGELGQAVLDLEQFTEKHAAHPLAASAHFWIGEAYFRSRDFEHAAGEYQRAIDLAPTGERTPDALLRLGLALRSLRREDRAREVWARLMRDFPDSEAALRARAVLRQPGRAVRPAEPR